MDWAKTRRWFFRGIIILGIAVAGWLISRALTQYGVSEILSAWSQIGTSRLLLAGAFMLASYTLLTGFDYLGLHYAKHPLPYPQAALASAVSLSIGHNIGVAALSSGAIRYRYYSRWGLGAEEVAKVVAFSGMTVGIGLATLAGIALVLYPSDAEQLLGIGAGWTRMVAVLCLVVPVVWCAAAALLRKQVRIKSWTIELPSLRLAIGQVVIGTANFACVAACLHQLLASFADLAYVRVAAIYVVANGTALISHVPGGLGVLEATANYLLQGTTSLPALIAFRVVYFFIPISIGLPVFGLSELFLRKRTAVEA